jgi:predicted PurR-regulated permease PerM
MIQRTSVDVSWRTILRVLVAAALVWVWIQIWQSILVCLISIIIAITLDPLVRALEKRGVSRGLAAAGSVIVLALFVVAMLAASWVSLTQQARVIVENLSAFSNRMLEQFPVLQQIMPAEGQGISGLDRYATSFLRSTSNAIGMVVLALVLTVYLLTEWRQTLEWLLAFVPVDRRRKVRRTLSEAHDVMYAYAVGNFITSVITAVATFIVLIALKVPAALLLAIIAGVFDFVPVVGFILSGALTALLAATVSMTALAAVVAFYILFNMVENYFITPKVYGRGLQLSDLAVLLAIVIGAQLGGVVGALLALPIAAIYPTIERGWLREPLGEETVEEHERQSVRRSAR